MKKKILLALTLLAGYTFSGASTAGGSAQNSTITELAIHRHHGNYVFIRVDVTPTDKASCSTNGY